MKPARVNTVSEKQFQAQVIDLAKLFHWKTYHTFDSRRSEPGFPDIVMVRPPVILFAELKAATGEVRPKQAAWLDALGRCETVEAALWRPSDWPTIREEPTPPMRHAGDDAELNRLIERRADTMKKNGKDAELEEMWKASERRDRERRRRENRALWYEFHMRLSEAHARLSAEHEESALKLLEDERDGAEAAHDRHKSGTREARKRPAAAGVEETEPKTLSQGGTTT